MRLTTIFCLLALPCVALILDAPQGLEAMPYSEEQALGTPSAPRGGGPEMSWQPLAGDTAPWLLLEFDAPVKAGKIRIFPATAVNALKEISAVDAQSNESSPWKSDGAYEGHSAPFIDLPCADIPTTTLIKLSARPGIRIDAVALLDADGTAHWAINAQASSTEAHGPTDDIRRNARAAERLMASGRRADIPIALERLEIVLANQERRVGHPHHGGYARYADIPGVPDRNWSAFVTRSLIPMMLQHGDRLPESMATRVRDSIRIALDDIRRMDVAVTYTNIAAMDCLVTSLGGELFQDKAIAQRGYDKTRAFADFLFKNGAIFEFNSPTYTAVTVDAFHRLAQHTTNDEIRNLARLINARILVSHALHVHENTGRLSGPHSRAYPFSIYSEVPPDTELLARWNRFGAAPDWALDLTYRNQAPRQIRETAVADWKLDMTSWLAPDFALGTASKEISRQTNVFSLLYALPGDPRPGAVYARYLLDDTWFGTPGVNPVREATMPPFDQGLFRGVQDGPRVLGLYAPRTYAYPRSLAPCSADGFSTAKAMLIWTRRDTIDEIWINDRPVDAFPAPLAPGDVVVTAMGSVLLALRPLTCTDLGVDAPMRLNVVENELVLEMYNYIGPQNQNLTTDRMSRFYRGLPQCGFYAEVAQRADYANAPAFAKTIRTGHLRDEAQAPFTAYMEEADRLWTVEYARDGKRLGIEVDLMEWRLQRRWNQAGPLGWPALESPTAQQNNSGHLQAADATLECAPHPAWLTGNPEKGIWVVGYHGPPAPLTLTLPNDKVEIPNMTTGLLIYDAGKVRLENLSQQQESSR
jgi:hypothetical protein